MVARLVADTISFKSNGPAREALARLQDAVRESRQDGCLLRLTAKLAPAVHSSPNPHPASQRRAPGYERAWLSWGVSTGGHPRPLPLQASGTLSLLPTEPSGNSHTETMDSNAGTSVVLYPHSLPMPKGNDCLIQQVPEAP